MTTSSQITLLSEARNIENPLSKRTIWYFRGRLQNRIYDLVLSEFAKQKEKGLKKSDLARRLGKPREQITRWLGAPNNLTLATLSDLLLAMGCELSPSIVQAGESHNVSNISNQDIAIIKSINASSSAVVDYRLGNIRENNKFEDKMVVIN